jgi:hypothetical protein
MAPKINRPARVLTEVQVRIADRVRKCHTNTSAHDTADKRPVQQTVVPLRMGWTRSQHGCGNNDRSEHHRPGHGVNLHVDARAPAALHHLSPAFQDEQLCRPELEIQDLPDTLS